MAQRSLRIKNKRLAMRFEQEDFERQAQLDYMYLKEREMEMQQEYEEWLEEEALANRLPAKIEILTKEFKPIEHEDECNSLPLGRVK